MAPEKISGVITINAEQVVTLLTERSPPVLLDSHKEKEYTKGQIEEAINLLDTTMTPNAWPITL